MNRIKWNRAMYYRCINRVQHIVNNINDVNENMDDLKEEKTCTVTDSENSIYGIGVGQFIECEIVTDHMSSDSNITAERENY